MSATLLLSSVSPPAGVRRRSGAVAGCSLPRPTRTRRDEGRGRTTPPPAPGRARRCAGAFPTTREIVYSNTSNFGGLYTVGIGSLQYPGQVVYDEGVLPSIGNGTVGFGTAPDQGTYLITGFEIRYCDFKTAPMSSNWTYTFYESFDPAVDPASVASPNATVDLVNLPANGCWTVTVDLTGGSEFQLTGDGGAAAPRVAGRSGARQFRLRHRVPRRARRSARGGLLRRRPRVHGRHPRIRGRDLLPRPHPGDDQLRDDRLGCPRRLDGDGRRDDRPDAVGLLERRRLRPGNAPVRLDLPAHVRCRGTGLGRPGSYCPQRSNSTGVPGQIQATNASQGRLTLSCTDLPPNVFGFFLVSRAPDRTATRVALPATSASRILSDVSTSPGR